MNSIVITILSLSISGSVLALMLFVGKPFLTNRVSKAFSYYIWLLVLMRLVVPISTPVNVMGTLFHSEQSGSVDVQPDQTDSPMAGNTVGTVGESAVTTNPQTTSSQERQNAEGQTTANVKLSFDLWGFIQSNLLWLWLTGAAVSIGWFFIAYTVFSRRLRRSCTVPQGDDLSVFEHLRGKMRVRLVCSSYVTTPMSMGILRPVIVLPQLAYVHNGMGDELKNILLHELTHCRRKDVLYKWIVVVVTSLHWFNPLMLWIRKEIGRACELSCDEAVISGMSESERQLYGNTLLTFSAGRKLLAGILTTTLCEGKEQLKERLISIMKYKKKPVYAIVLSFVLMLLITGSALALGVVNESSDETVSKNSASLEHDNEEQTNNSDAQIGTDNSGLVATISLSDVEQHEAPEVEITTVSSSDVASVIVSYVCGNGTEVMFYRAQNGGIYCAYKTDDGNITRFYEASIYEDGYDIQPYEDVFDHNGFYIRCPVGAAYTAIDYYYFEADGTLKLLVQCDNYVIENDMDGDGKKELLSFYHGLPDDDVGAGMAFYCFERDGRIYETALDNLLMNEFPDIDFPGHFYTCTDDSSLLCFAYHLNGEDNDNREFELRFTVDSMTVYQTTSDSAESSADATGTPVEGTGPFVGYVQDATTDTFDVYTEEDGIGQITIQTRASR